MESSSDANYFDQIPKELTLIIISYLNLNLREVLRIQAISKKWKDLLWSSVTDLDTRLFKASEKATILPIILSRLNFSCLRSIVQETVAEIPSKYIEKCASLKYLEIRDYQIPFNDCHGLKQLGEYSCESYVDLLDLDVYAEANLPCRFNALFRSFLAGYSPNARAVFPQFNFSPVRTEFRQQEPIKFNKNFHRGGMINEELFVIGATDGTLMFLKLDSKTQSLTIHSVNNTHKGCINEIWTEQSLCTYVASSDGIVTAWHYDDNGPVLKRTLQFPESILFVCHSPLGDVVAAGARTVYFANLISGDIIKQMHVDEDITGLFGNRFQCTLSTRTRYYRQLHMVDSMSQAMSIEASTPNFWIAPDGSIRAVVFPNQVQLMDADQPFKQYPNPQNVTFDSRPGSFKYSPLHYWGSVSTGTNIVTYDMMNDSEPMMASVSARISRSEFNEGKFPICSSFWYCLKSEYLFGLFSNNSLCWWQIIESSV